MRCVWLQERVNAGGHVGVRRLCTVPRGDVSIVHEGQESKRKTYACVVWAEKPLSQQQMQTINSTTVRLPVQCAWVGVRVCVYVAC